MALSIVPPSLLNARKPAGVKTASNLHCDFFMGSLEALISAGHLTSEQLAPQPGRALGSTAFLPTGEPCPAHVRGWREPGFKSIRAERDGTYTVSVTVSKELQMLRRRAKVAKKKADDRERVQRQLTEGEGKYEGWQLRHSFNEYAHHGGGSVAPYETWEGTKEQLQREGLGIGQPFPGEPGARDDLHCKCPLGFDVRVYLPTYDVAMAAAGVYRAISYYIPVEQGQKFVEHAPGVMRAIWTPDNWRHVDVFYGTPAALVEAGMVPSVSIFPGQPGMNKVSASYLKDWRSATTAPRSETAVTIRKHSSRGVYCLEVRVTAEEAERRELACHAHKASYNALAAELAAERRALREGRKTYGHLRVIH